MPRSAKVSAVVDDRSSSPEERRQSAAMVHDASEILSHEPKTRTAAEHEENLRNAFSAMDGDGSGLIDVKELSELLKAQGHDLSEKELKVIMKHLDSDGNVEELSFDEFKQVMADLEHGTDLGDIAEHFAKEMKGALGLAKAAMPLWEQLEEKRRNGEELSPWESFQNRAGQILDGTGAQMVIMVLIVIDVIAVICELLLGATACSDCNASCGHPLNQRHLSSMASSEISQLHRHLGGAVDISYHNTSIECNMDHVWQKCTSNAAQVSWNTWLHNISVGILGVFALQLILLMFVYQKQFFCSVAYMADTVVVGAALVLENIPNAKQGGLFVVLLSWRILRIVHGVISSVEINNTMKEREIDKEAVELSEKHEKETAELHEIINTKWAPFAEQKQKIQSLIDNNKTAESAPETAKGFLALCSLIEELNGKVEAMKAHIHHDVEEHKQVAKFDKNPVNNDDFSGENWGKDANKIANQGINIVNLDS